MRAARSYGIMLHPTSLPDPPLGQFAYRFVDWMQAAGASWWQVLPLHPPDVHGSPYASLSAFAGWSGFLAQPSSEVSDDELDELRGTQGYWLSAWEGYFGVGAVENEVRFRREWRALRTYALERGVRIIGDVPIYVARGGCDHVTRPELFLPGGEAGAPPDDLNDEGQRWSSPLYDWEAMAADGYRWWIERLRCELDLVDAFRIDHFRGFASYWVVPDGADSAQDGSWRPGPGVRLFQAAESALGRPLPVIAENLGVITADVERLRGTLGYPGMVVMQWAFEGGPENPHRLENHDEHSVVYSSTHDTQTLAGRYPDRDHRELVELTLSSRARLAVLPLQDVLGLGNEARLNRPGTTGGNWSWRLEQSALDGNLAAWLADTAAAAGRRIP